MKGTTRFLVWLAISIVGIVVLAFITYKFGGVIGKALLANEFTQHKINFQIWEAQYLTAVQVLAGFTFGVQLFWCGLAQYYFKITDMTGVAKRKFWLMMLAVEAVFCVVFPYIWSILRASFLMTPVLIVLFLIIFTLLGFWGLSIWATPAAYKYTPIGAVKLRNNGQRK